MPLNKRAREKISIHSPYTGRDSTGRDHTAETTHFNPLSLYRERLAVTNAVTYAAVFQSTLPIQGETKSFRPLGSCTVISIHSPYTGRDESAGMVQQKAMEFQSTLPIQGET